MHGDDELLDDHESSVVRTCGRALHVWSKDRVRLSGVFLFFGGLLVCEFFFCAERRAG